MSFGAHRTSSAPQAAVGTRERRTGGVKVNESPPRVTTGFILDLPLPPSVNRTLGKLGNTSPGIAKWRKLCDGYLFAEWGRIKRQAVKGDFAIDIAWTSAEFKHSDIDNRVKPLLDYLQDRELIENDRLCRVMVVHWGAAVFGCRVCVEPWEAA